jgi:hypothetical protein
MSETNQDHCDRKIVLIAISAAVLAGTIAIGSQFVQLSMAQNLGQMGEQLGQQARERIGGALGGNQRGAKVYFFHIIHTRSSFFSYY